MFIFIFDFNCFMTYITRVILLFEQENLILTKKECDNYNIRSFVLVMYLQKVHRSKISHSDDKRCYESNPENKPRGMKLKSYIVL